MKYIGLQTQINRNNFRSLFLLICFPVLVLSLVWLFYFLLYYFATEGYATNEITQFATQGFVESLPYVVIGTLIWFAIAFFSHSYIINQSAGSHSLSRKDDKRVYNLLENLCISKGMQMPKLQVIETQSLNAFASGINEKTYTITLTRGIINTLDDDELEGVIAHELCHIRNRDVRLLIVSIIFVGIFSFLTSILLRTLIFGGGRRKKQDARVVIIALIIAALGYLITILLKFSLSRKREYLADAGAAEMTHKPRALASALRKISGHSEMPEVKSSEVAELYIDNSPPKNKSFMSSVAGMFATHPPIDNRIEILEQM